MLFGRLLARQCAMPQESDPQGGTIRALGKSLGAVMVDWCLMLAILKQALAEVEQARQAAAA